MAKQSPHQGEAKVRLVSAGTSARVTRDQRFFAVKAP
jgi:hypothetical protein